MTDFNHAPVCQPEPAIFDSSWNNANVPSQYRNVKREVYLRVFYLICIWHCFVSHYLKKMLAWQPLEPGWPIRDWASTWDRTSTA